MFGFFRRNTRDFLDWEKEGLSKILQELGNDYGIFVGQLNEVKKIDIDERTLPYMYGLEYSVDFYAKNEQRKSSNFKIEGIRIYNLTADSWMDITLYFASAMVLAYSIDKKKRKISI
ncbi:hypothetical protein [Sphingobacterium sp. LRF_L2]|uniref:hypothetical protein n=1 Tax=Sphingobacterium sp. LRF_L2 TaxID=3369421 RepID=UPI003F63075B